MTVGYIDTLDSPMGVALNSDHCTKICVFTRDGDTNVTGFHISADDAIAAGFHVSLFTASSKRSAVIAVAALHPALRPTSRALVRTDVNPICVVEDV